MDELSEEAKKEIIRKHSFKKCFICILFYVVVYLLVLNALRTLCGL